MNFALSDYISYRRRSGRFRRSYEVSWMGASFLGSLPPNVFRALQPGDALFIQTMNSWLSWLVMYFTNSEISHVAQYIGGRQIIHATTSGVFKESIDDLIDEYTLTLPCTWPMTVEQREDVVPTLENYVNKRYSWSVVALKCTRILLGRDWKYFRKSFFVDLFVILTILDTYSLISSGHIFFLWLMPLYFCVVSINYLISKARPLLFDEKTVKPHELLEVLVAKGGTCVFDAHELSKQQSQHRNLG